MTNVIPIHRYVKTPNRWKDPITAWRAWLKAGAVSHETLALRTYQLQRFAVDHARRAPYSLTPDDLGAWLADHDWSAESLRSYRAALRSFYGWAHAAGHTETDPARLLRKVKPGAARPRPAPEAAIDQALAAADPRTWLLLMLGSRQGLRRGEMARIHTDDILRDDDGWSLIVHGKGDKDRVVPLLPAIAAALRARPAGWIFPNGKGGPITSAHVGVLIRRVLHGASAHQLRHRFASRTYQATTDIRAVQELLGHASVATTQRYTAVADGALRRVMQTAA